MSTPFQCSLRLLAIDALAEKTIKSQENKLTQKYSKIEGTLKMLNTLLVSFKKKSDSYEQQLRKDVRIDEIQDKINFHKNRIEECVRLSESLKQKVECKKQEIGELEERVVVLRKEIIRLKTDNVKKSYLFEKQSKTEQKKSLLKDTIRFNKTCFNHIKTMTTTTKANNIQSLYQIIDRRFEVTKFLQEGLRALQDKLHSFQKKSNVYGLNGSLLFKITKNHSFVKKQFRSTKLIIYDVLKNRHYNYKKQVQDKTQQFQLSEQQFLHFTPLQIMGVIQLKGGLNKLIEVAQKKDLSLRKMLNSANQQEANKENE